MAARFVLNKVGCETMSLCAFGATTRVLCALEPTSRMGDSGYQDKAAVGEDAATSKEFNTSRFLYAVLMTMSSGEHWHHCY